MSARIVADAYREEAAEILVSLEAALLELEEKPRDGELVATVFRALHTIKGSGAMFGFDSIAAFAHELETVFDHVRDGLVPVTAELIGVTLAARDHIERMLGGENDSAEAAEILQRLYAVANCQPSAAPKPQRDPVMAPLSGELQIWKILFEPSREILRNGANPLLLIRELRQCGDLKVAAHLEEIPDLGSLDPTECHVAWDFLLTTAADENAIRDIFIFVEDQATILIERLGEAGAGQPTASNPHLGKPLGLERPKDDKGRACELTSTLRVRAEKLDRLVNVVGELVTVQARLSGYALDRDDPEMTAIAEEIERLTETLRENTMDLRMLPIGEAFGRFKRLVRDLSAELGKNVELVLEGSDTELDKTVIEQLADPMLHLMRNAVDHGIEPPEERVRAGKPPIGQIRLSASHAGAFVHIAIEDDGPGLNRAAIRDRAVERGLIPAGAPISDSEADRLIFEAGFSTASQVTGISGRGVGLDVVRKQLDSLRGNVSVTSVSGRGTTVTLRIPLTLAMIEGLLVECGGASFVVPLSNVSECTELASRRSLGLRRTSLVDVRGEQMPYIVLRDRFGIAGEPPLIEQVIVTETRQGRFGLVVDRVLGGHHTVIKKLGGLYRRVEEISGATILGDGSIALVLDVERICAGALVSSSLPIARTHARVDS